MLFLPQTLDAAALASAPASTSWYRRAAACRHSMSHAALLSLPALFRTRWTTIPRRHTLHRSQPGAGRTSRAVAESIGGFKVGIAWQGSTQHKGDRWRSIPLRQFAPLARCRGCVW